MKTKIFLMTLVLSLPLAAMATDKPGAEARAWVDLQESGKAASTVERPMPGEAADKVYQRYLKTFDHPIPENFSRESFVGSGGSGGGGSGGSGNSK